MRNINTVTLSDDSGFIVATVEFELDAGLSLGFEAKDYDRLRMDFPCATSFVQTGATGYAISGRFDDVSADIVSPVPSRVSICSLTEFLLRMN